jgi:hypothetical protein
MTEPQEKQLELEILMSLENAACIGRSQQDYGEYCKRLTAGIMNKIRTLNKVETVGESK